MSINLSEIRSGIALMRSSFIRQDYGHINFTFVSGPPSSGKNTRVEIVKSACDCEVRSHDIGTIIGEEISSGSDIGKIFSQSSKIQEKGGLQQDEPIIYALFLRIKASYIFGAKRHLVCGFPRSLSQARFLLDSCLCFNLKSINASRERCFHLLSKRKALKQRPDDNSFDRRWETFTRNTVPAIELIQKRNPSYLVGDKGESDILQDCLDIIGALGLGTPEHEEAVKNLTVRDKHPARQAILRIMADDNSTPPRDRGRTSTVDQNLGQVLVAS